MGRVLGFAAHRAAAIVAIALAVALLTQCASAPEGSSPAAVGGAGLVIDARAASLYLDLLSYIRSVHGDELGLSQGSLTPAEVAARAQSNREDPLYIRKVDALLAHPAYTELARAMRSYSLGYKGKRAYRETFYRLPWERTGLRGGVDETILAITRSLDAATAAAVSKAVEELSTPAASERVLATASPWLPAETTRRGSYRVFVYFDGNRGSFATGRAIYLDLVWHRATLSEPAGLPAMEAILSHELHHVAYARWLRRHAPGLLFSPFYSARRAALSQWQVDLLLEGAAQFCDFPGRPEVVQAMQLDPEMNAVMFGVVEKTFLSMARGEMSLAQYRKLREDYANDVSRDLFMGYLARSRTPEEIEALMGPDRGFMGYRPVPHYFVGYRIFREIERVGGPEGFLDAMTHPRELFHRYREIAAGDPSLPQISQELADLWATL